MAPPRPVSSGHLELDTEGSVLAIVGSAVLPLTVGCLDFYYFPSKPGTSNSVEFISRASPPASLNGVRVFGVRLSDLLPLSAALGASEEQAGVPAGRRTSSWAATQVVTFPGRSGRRG